MDSGTGTDPSTERCPDCGHLQERVCGCSCCGTGGYPVPHYDEYDDCQCPDHVAMRAARRPSIYNLPIFGWAWGEDARDRRA